MGLSFAELNMLTLNDYTAFIDEWGKDPDAPRKATQEDIDALLG